MGIFSWIKKLFKDASLGDGTVCGNSSADLNSHYSFWDDDFIVNPATGLPMIGGRGGVDAEGNPYGADLRDDEFGKFNGEDNW